MPLELKKQESKATNEVSNLQLTILEEEFKQEPKPNKKRTKTKKRKENSKL
jgi:hypothetical protein